MSLNFSTSQADVAENIIREHDALRHKVRAIHSVLSERDPNPGEIEALLREFLNALVVHFANEEDTGFFHKVAVQSPRLAETAGRLSVEHRELLHEAEELCRFAEAGAPSMPWWRELQSRCHNFNQRLMHHESEEHHLLQHSQRTEINSV
jgi:iron-sulfur cluster repair protein YtfE (RIC family)